MLALASGRTGVLGSVATNVSLMMGAQTVTFALTFALRAALGRYLGDAGFGKLTFALSLGAVFAMVAGLGLGPLVAKESARTRDRAGEYLANSLLLRLGSGLILFAAYCGLVSVLKDDPETRYLAYLVGFSLLISSLVAMIGAVFQAYERMVYVAIGVIAEKTLATGLIIALLASGHGILAVGWVMVFASLANLAISWRFLRRLGSLRFGVELRAARKLLVASMPFFVWAVSATIYARIDATMLSLMTNDAVTGWYGVAFALYETLTFLPAMLKTVLLPILSRLHLADRAHLRLTFRESFYVFSLIAPPIAFGVFVLARPIVGLVYPLEQFAEAVDVMRILALGLVPLFYNILLATTLVAVDKQRYWSIAAVACAFINPALNIFLIPLYQSTHGNGGIGAAWATNIVEVLLLAVAVILLPRGLVRAQDVSLVLCATLAGALMGAVLWLTAPPLPIAVPLGAAVYVLCCLALGAARLGELKAFLTSIRAREARAGIAATGGKPG